FLEAWDAGLEGFSDSRSSPRRRKPAGPRARSACVHGATLFVSLMDGREVLAHDDVAKSPP
ncbi:MAG: hypothetical protein Q8K55_05250, partial [Gemmatimonadaceae bacterium]|nr:hypothetical protein [Gemmatimonadaceae bacterium]